MLPSATWHLVGQNEPVPQKWIGRCSTSTTPARVFGKGSPLPTRAPQILLYQTNICARILIHRSAQAMAVLRREDLWRERTELGSSCSVQHGAFCSMWFSAGNLYGCFSLGKWEISPSPSIPREKAVLAAREALRWSRHEGNRKTDVGESSACLEGKSYTFFKWSLIWYSHPEKQI